jgi:PAS domain S-box-containing protein
METNNSQINILIAEDSPTQAEELRFLLEKSGYNVTVVENGLKALEFLKNSKTDILISDIVMPEMDGYELCKTIRSNDNLRNLPVVLLTSLSDPIDVIKGLGSGANNFIPKPFDEKLLLSHIEYILMNIEIRRTIKAELGISVFFMGQTFFISADRLQILDLLLSTYESAYHQNKALFKSQQELNALNEQLEEIVQKRTAELHKSNEELKKAEAEWERTFDSIIDPIMILDSNHKIIRSNKALANKLGITPKETEGLTCYECMHDNTEPIPECPHSQLLIDGQPHSAEVHIDRMGGDFLISVAPLFNAEGKLYGSIHFAFDITAQKKLQAAEISKLYAEAANRAKSDFLANMSHELRTPLNSIIGFSQILGDGIVGDLTPQQKECVGNIGKSGEHLLSLINDILDLSKVEVGKLELSPTNFILHDVITSSVLLLQEKALKNKISLTFDIKQDADVLIYADMRKLKQILLNLLSNAVKFTPDGGSVRITVRKIDSSEALKQMTRMSQDVNNLDLSGDFMEISVADTGIGVKPENMTKLFKEFSQIELPYTKTYEGTGLGLSLSKKLVELHGGRIWAESIYEKGSTFTFIIPWKQGEKNA